MKKIRVVIADDQRRVRLGLKMLLELEPDIAVVGEAEDGLAAVRVAGELEPDVIVMDLSMPQMDGFAATEAITSGCGDCAIVVHTLHDDRATKERARTCGAAEFVSKQQGEDALVQAIRRADAGRASHVG